MSNPQEMMKIGTELVECCNSGRELELLQNHYSDNAVSAEAMAMPGGNKEVTGRDAIKAKGEWWNSAHDVHAMKAEGPFVHDDKFSVIFDMDVTNKESGQRMQMREVGTYQVAGGKIVREEFAYALG